jgi:hypothetical protein
MDLLGAFGYAPSMASMALLTSINSLAILDNQHSQNDWRNGGEVGVEVACEDWR